MSFALAIPLIGKVIDRIIPDPAQKAEATLKLNELAQQGALAELDADVRLMTGQMEVNRAEAGHASIFVAGWRPFVGWVCGIALGYHFIAQPFANWIAFLAGVDLDGMPALEMGDLMTVLLGMLGIGGMRTYEKRAGVARRSLRQ